MRGPVPPAIPVICPIVQWGLLVSTLTLAGMISGWAAGMALAAVSGDYVAMPSDQVGLGLRAGLFASTVMAVWHHMSKQAPLSLRERLSTSIAVLLGAWSVICTLLLLAALLSTLHAILLQDANLAHPRRHVIFVFMHHAWPVALLAGALLGEWLIGRKRARQVVPVGPA